MDRVKWPVLHFLLILYLRGLWLVLKTLAVPQDLEQTSPDSWKLGRRKTRFSFLGKAFRKFPPAKKDFLGLGRAVLGGGVRRSTKMVLSVWIVTGTHMNRSLTVLIPFSMPVPFNGPDMGWISGEMEGRGWL